MKKIKIFSLLGLCMLICTQSINAIINEDEISLRSENVVLYHLDDTYLMYEKQKDERIYPASLTKIMSALVAIEHIDNLDDTVVINEEMLAGLKEENASMAGFEINETLTYQDLLYGILLPSGADASRAVAFSLFGNEENFVNQMNKKAESLHLKNTHFVNTSGLHDDMHYTTVDEVANLLMHALKNKVFKEIFCSSTYLTSNQRLSLRSTRVNQAYSLQEDISFITGGKTGFTNEASLCFASYVKRDHEEYIMVSAQTNSNQEYPFHLKDAHSLYMFVFNQYQKKMLFNKQDVIAEIEVLYAKEKILDVKASNDIDVILRNSDVSNLKYEFVNEGMLEAPIKKGEVLGTFEIYDGETRIYHEVYKATEDIERNHFTFYLHHPLTFLFDFWYAFIILLVFVVVMKRKKKR